MTRKQLKLQSKPVNLLCLVPSQEQKQHPNPFEPSRLRMAMRKVAVTMEDMTERFEAWCEPTPGMPTLSLAQRMQRWIGKSEPSTTALSIRNEQMMHSPRWELSVAEVIFRIRDRAGHVQRALMAQAHELKGWMAHHTLSTQNELNSLREQVVTQDAQLQQLQTQLQDLRALVSSQQRVLVYMGKELDTVQQEASTHRANPSRKAGGRSKKSAKAKRRTPADVTQIPYLNA
ncbi:MAG: hypothetical protein ABW047_05975 [Nitrospiraceae bacterium]